jgi:hypothetical protein
MMLVQIARTWDDCVHRAAHLTTLWSFSTLRNDGGSSMPSKAGPHLICGVAAKAMHRARPGDVYARDLGFWTLVPLAASCVLLSQGCHVVVSLPKSSTR